MLEADRRRARNSVLALLVIGVIVSTVGYQYREHQRAKQITWQDVSNTLQHVEDAKLDLFQSLNAKVDR